MEGMRVSWSEDQNRKTMKWSQNNEMRWKIKRVERGKAGEDIRGEGGEMVGKKS